MGCPISFLFLQNMPQAEIARTINILTQARTEGKRIFLMGNGSSAAMASHSACDLCKGTVQEGKPRFKAISLNDNVPPKARQRSLEML